MDTKHTRWSDLPGIRVEKAPAICAVEVRKIMKKGRTPVGLLLQPKGQIAIIGVESNVDDGVALALARVACQHVRDSLPLAQQNLAAPIQGQEVFLLCREERRLSKFSALEGINCTAYVFMLADDNMPVSSVRFSSYPPDDELLIAVGRQLIAWHVPLNSKQGGPAV